MHYPSSAKKLAIGVPIAVLALTITSCGSDSDSSQSQAADPVRMAFVNGFSGGGPVDDFVAGLTCYADKNGLDDPVVTTADGDVNKQLTDIDSLIARASSIDGMFVLPVDPAALRPAYERAKDAGMVVIDPISPNPDGTYATEATGHVAPDDAGVPKMIVDYLVEQGGITRMAILSPPPGQTMSDQKSADVTKLAEEADIEVADDLHMDQITTEEAQKQVEDLLTRDHNIDAIFAQNGAMARGAFLAGQSQDVDLTIVSIDSDAETLAAVKAGDIDATFGADLFTVGYLSSVQAEKAKAGETIDFVSVPYKLFTKDNAVVASAEERCAAVEE